MISAERFIDSARQLGFALYTGVPCSYLKPFINYVIDAGDLRMRVRRAQHVGARLLGRRHVVQIPSASAQQSQIFLSFDGFPDTEFAHRLVLSFSMSIWPRSWP